MAWLQSAPSSDKDKTTRAKKILSVGGKPSMPPLHEAAYIVHYWQQAGMVQAGAMSAVPLTAAELHAWQQVTGTELDGFEAQTILEASRAYVVESQLSEKPDHPAPYSTREMEHDRDKVAKSLKLNMQAFISALKGQ